MYSNVGIRVCLFFMTITVYQCLALQMGTKDDGKEKNFASFSNVGRMLVPAVFAS